MSGATLGFISAGLAGILMMAMLFHERRTLAHWLFLAGMTWLLLERLFAGFSAVALDAAELHQWQNWRVLVLSLLPGAWALFSLAYARGDASSVLPRSVWYLAPLFLVPAGVALLSWTSLVTIVSADADPRILRIELSFAAKVVYLAVLLGSVMVLMNLERTYRASVGTMRWRIKFMILGLGVLFAVLAYTSSQALLFSIVNPSLEVLFSGAVIVSCLLILRSLFRTGHFEVSVYPSQLVLHNSLTVLLAGVYLVIVGILGKAAPLLGDAAGIPLRAFLVLIALVVLSVLLLSDRMRLHTRQFISRHFQRPLYDYRTVWRTFAEGTTRCLEERQLCSAVVKLASEIFQALSVTIWLVDDKHRGLHLVASSSLKSGEGHLQASDAAELIRAFSERPDPIDVDSSKEFWASALRRAQPGEFRKGGNRAAVALQAGGEILGILMLGDRVGGVAFTLQDFDLLKAIADQAAANLLNINLAQKLSQAKQLEAFQAMSAFFVHDLKNTASTLSLMLQNLPVHYQDPKFREDALRGISKTVAHINDLISRLSVLRHELAINAVECDLNALVQETLALQEQAGGFRVRRELGNLPRLQLDPGQIQKVLTNLLMNAREAIGADGQITVETSQANGWAVVTVSDTGCGMTPEFIDHRLFRPFQTTKKRGIGIGMFHCKMIVEAHRGRIEVRSEPGKGTAFRVLLPIAAA